MKRIVIEPEFEIGQRVYYRLPDSPAGMVTDIVYRQSTGNIVYEVTFDANMAALEYFAFELTGEKVVV